MRTEHGVSTLATSQVLTTVVGLVLVHSLLGLVDFCLLFKNARRGPAAR